MIGEQCSLPDVGLYIGQALEVPGQIRNLLVRTMLCVVRSLMRLTALSSISYCNATSPPL